MEEERDELCPPADPDLVLFSINIISHYNSKKKKLTFGG